jgi:hypothetical protein
MVQFPGCAFRILWIQTRMSGIQPDGLPHSAIRGSRDVCSSPRLFAAYHGLLRTAAPRHPPWTLSRLTILSFALQSGLRRRRASPLSGLPPEPVPQTPAAPLKKLPSQSSAPASPSTPSGFRLRRHAALSSRTPPRLSGNGRRTSSSPFPCIVKELPMSHDAIAAAAPTVPP